jgi:hypothetical protein
LSASSTFFFSWTTAPRRKPPSAVMMSDRAAVGDAVGDRMGAEAAEDHGMDGADAGAGEHGDGGFGNEGEVDEDAVALGDAVAFEDVGEAADLAVELFVREGAFLAGPAVGGGFAFPDEGGLVGDRGVEPAVEAVDRQVEASAAEPFGDGLLPLEDLLEGGEPDEFLLGDAAPEAFGMFDRFAVEFAIGREGFDVGLGGELLGPA